jgi:hypothetical protein
LHLTRVLKLQNFIGIRLPDGEVKGNKTTLFIEKAYGIPVFSSCHCRLALQSKTTVLQDLLAGGKE